MREPPGVRPATAQQATARVLWGRRTLAFPSTRALLLAPDGSRRPVRLAWPQDAAKASICAISVRLKLMRVP